MADGRHPLEDGCPEDWVTAWGQDEYGIFVGFEVGGVEQRLRWIGPGRFEMGSPDGELGQDDDETRHTVTLTQGYWMADTPVTQALWAAVMGDNPSHFKGDETRPVESVSWDDSQRFIELLNDTVVGLNARLPTEAEWERGCRAGTKTATYAGDLEADQVAPVLEAIAWYGHNSGDTTQPVKRKQPNAWGLYDTLGNVSEWCQDYAYRTYTSEPQQDPTGAATGGYRVFRGGPWGGRARGVRAAYRNGGVPDDRFSGLGLRLVRDQAVRKDQVPEGE